MGWKGCPVASWAFCRGSHGRGKAHQMGISALALVFPLLCADEVIE
jgi:hypothetical protein